MTDGNAIRGMRLGSGTISGDVERGESAPRQQVEYWCDNGHRVRPAFAVDAHVPDTWECTRCGLPAGRDRDNPPAPKRTEPYKSHFAYVKERRSDADGMELLDEALRKLRERRGRSGER
ncbi:RNA polymerase-binding protein RbpA [Actinopolyspora mortivallis]|uniref:RNA polymerase-binding protein RbpA n=1 Tax=Actinopolyspora mortivallis TaxID=33906 RepID=UPI0012EE7D9C|nr:RNA polymerase-binding protein RbpA [Actinopolyspora mortivallis]